MKEIKLFLLIKDRLFRECIKQYLNSCLNIEVVSDADNLKVLSNQYTLIPPDTILIVDEKLQDSEGLKEVLGFLSVHPETKIIGLFAEPIDIDTTQLSSEKNLIGFISMDMSRIEIKDEIERFYYNQRKYSASLAS